MPSTLPRIVENPGQLPPFWPQSVLYYANLRALFFGNEEETNALCQAVGQIESYGGRLVPILNMLFRGPHNLLVLERAPDPVLLEYFARDLRLPVPRHHVLSHRDYRRIADAVASGDRTPIERLLPRPSGAGGDCVDGYVTDSTLRDIAVLHRLPTLSTPEGSRRGNNKLLLHRFLTARGLPVFDTEVVEAHRGLAGALDRLHRRGFRRAVIKAPIGASGIGLRRVDLPVGAETLANLPAMLFFEGPCLVQGWLEAGVHGVARIRSPSVQIFVGTDEVHLYDITEQILSDDSVHEGNEAFPDFLGEHPGLQEELLQLAGAAGCWLHEIGYRGVGSADFVVPYDRGGRPRAPILCEVNARVTGATYPSVLARHFHPGGAWIMRNIRFLEASPGEALLRELRDLGVLFAHGSASGVLPINFNPDDEGRVAKAQFLIVAAALDECREIMRKLREHLALRVDYDRD